MINNYCEVLIENKTKSQNKFFGRNKFMTPVILNSDDCQPGDIVNTLVDSSNSNSLFGSYTIENKVA